MIKNVNPGVITNKLLAVLDGTTLPLCDVIFIPVTNHPETTDPALLRAGLFAEKVQYFVADDVTRRGL